MIGSTIGPFKLVRELGTGGMGTVYLAEEGDRKVALKVVHPHMLESPGFFKRFMREGELGRRVLHRNVVRTFDVDAIVHEGRHYHYLVMEYVEGKSLRALLNEWGTVPEALLREIAQQAAAGLAAIHACDIIHRDLKPENILITDEHEIRIMDLGVARLQEASIAITKEGQFAGSLLYASPEQFRREDVGPASDLYALGVVLYELATGTNPFRADDTAAVIRGHLSEVPPKAHERNTHVSLFLSELIATLLEKKPGDRFASADALGAVLREAEHSPWWKEHEPRLRKQEALRPRIRVNREAKLHGRERDVARLHELFDLASKGHGRTVLLEGEAGIGKTRLVDAFAREVAGAHVLYGSYPPSGGLGGLSESILGKFGVTDLERALGPYLTATPSLVPAFAALLKHESPPTGSEPLGGEALQAVVVHLMHALSAERPTLWILDDLHFAPRESLDVLLAMARAVEDHRVLVVATARPGLDLSDFTRLPAFERRDIGRLSPREVIELLEDAFQSTDLADRLGARIAAKSDGVPFFIFEMIRGLKEGQFIARQPDGSYAQTQVISDIEVPSAVKDLIEHRLKDLTQAQRALLDVGAVQGLTFDPGLVAEVLGRNLVNALQDLAEIERRWGLVCGDGELVRFDQNQLQEVVYSGLLPRLRREYHTLVAKAHAGKDPVFLAYHHLRGSRPREALPHLFPALERLEISYRNEALLDLATRALAVEGLVEGGERIDVLLRKASRLDLLGRRDEERAALEEAVAVADATGDPALRGRAHRLLGTFWWGLSQHDTAERELRTALDLAKAAGDRKLEGQAVGGLGSVFLHLGRHAEATEHLERQRLLAHEIGDRRGEATATTILGVVLGVRGSHAEAEEHFERARTIAAKTGYRHAEAIANGNLGALFSSLGRFREAREYLERYRALAREIGYRRGEAIALGNLGEILFDLGRHSGAADHLERSRALSREIGFRHGVHHSVGSLAAVAEATGDLDGAHRLLAEGLQLQRELGEKEEVAKSLVALGRVEAAQGDATSATSCLDEAIVLARETGVPDTILMAAVERARLPGGDVEAALAALAEHEERTAQSVRMAARFRLWQLTGDRAHLEEARRLLDFAVDHAPEEDRETMVEKVPLHSEIARARER